MDAEVLQSTPHRRVVRVGDTVRRPLHPWSATVHELLRYLEDAGFRPAPRVLDADRDGCEVLTYIAGDSGPHGWARAVTDEGLAAMARLLREYHDAVAGFRPSPGATWAAHPGPVGAGEVVCHGDFGPWNLVWRGNQPIGILDWDYAWPQPPAHDVAYALEYVAPFRDDATCRRWLAYPAPPDRRRRIERFCREYRMDHDGDWVGAVAHQQQVVLDRTRRLAAAGHQPQASWGAAHLAECAERIAWTRAHRELFR
jgi:hypothetical protein